MKTKFALIFTAVLTTGLFVIVSCEGPMGPQGPQGEQGPPGLVGPAGSDGSIIHAGQGAPDQTLGKLGDFYLDLTTGNLFGPKMTEGWGAPANLQGPSGEDGQDGSQIYAGNGAPDNSQGTEGDYYLDKTNYELYGPKTADGWGTPINLQGPQGEQGEQGPPGEDGNANVRTFDFTVRAADWSQNLHYGSNNVYRTYDIPPDSTGGINVSSFFDSGGAIMVYAKNHSLDNIVGWHSLPFMYQAPDDGIVGIKITFFASRGSVAISQTTNGWDNNRIDEHLPDEVDFRMVFIENISLNKIAESGVDLDDYSSLSKYFGLNRKGH